MSLKTRILRAALFWTLDLFELFCLLVFVAAVAMSCSAYSQAQSKPPASHKIETRAPEYQHPHYRRVRLAKLEQGDEQ